MRAMSSGSPPTSALYRVTLFFGPEPVAERPNTLACVFNVKKRSWKAGIQVSVHLGHQQLSTLEQRLQLGDRLSAAFGTLDSNERAANEARVPDLFAQAVSWCKLDLHLQQGLVQENQALLPESLQAELEHVVLSRKEYVLSYILTELDLTHEGPSPSAR